MKLQTQLFKTSALNADLSEKVASSTIVLNGVTPQASQILKALGIESVFDLGASKLFSNAKCIVDFAEQHASTLRFDGVPSDWFNEPTLIADPRKLGQLPLTSLRGLVAVDAKNLSSALGISSIQDLAYWPPYVAANSLVSGSVGSSLIAEDIETERLRPRMGEFPTERVYYSTLVMLQMSADGPRRNLAEPLRLQIKAGQGKGDAAENQALLQANIKNIISS